MTEDDHPSTHPPLPPTTEEDRFARLRLLRSRRVGVSTYNRLIAEHGNASAALDALPDVARAAGDTDYTPFTADAAHAELRKGAKLGARLTFQGDRDYPTALNDLSDAPPCLWIQGNPEALNKPILSLVGARNASSLGLRMARALSAELGAAGHIIASGLARGIDTAAHEGALKSGTIAVLAGGLDVIYPSENTRLAAQIREAGALISEAPLGCRPIARHFPARNRIVSGISRGLVVIEAAAKSGSLITARCALDQGREVMAVPGHPFDARAAGCNMLIRDGATLVRRADDVFEAIGPLSEPELPLAEPAATTPAPRSLRETAALHQMILDRLSPSPVTEDQLIRDIAQPCKAVNPALTELELDGLILRQPGGMVSLNARP